MKTRKNIILIRPSFGHFVYKQINPPIGLGYLASYLMNHNYRVYILDLALRHITNGTLLALIKKINPLFVGISALTVYYSDMRSVSKYIKKNLPEMNIILGGVHVSALPEVSLRECNADFVVIGEGEQTLLELAVELEKENPNFSMIKGVAYLKENVIKINEKRELINDLDSLPIPAWHLINPNKYPKDVHGFMLKYSKIAPILSTRGCPFKCSYCASCQFWGQRIRFRTPKKVVDEIQFLHEKFGIREIHFWDDNLTLKREHIVEICREILKRKLNMAFCTPNGVKVDTLDGKLLKLMRSAGFYKLTFAVESGSYKILRNNNKKVDLKKIVKNTVIAKKLGFILNSFFIFGFPEEDDVSIRKTINYAKAVPFDFTTFFLMKPLPGSKLFDHWLAEKNLMDFDWSLINYYENKVSLCKFSPEKLEMLRKKAHQETILTPRGLFTRLWIKIITFRPIQLKYFIARVLHVIIGYKFLVFGI